MMCLVLSVMAFAQTGVDFQHLTFDEALAKAKAEKKLVFVDCYTTWCGPCKMMTTKIFPMKEAGEFFNPRFVCVKFDMEQGEGKELKNKLGVRAYPSFFIIRPDGTVQHAVVGGDELEPFIERVKKGLNEKTSLLYLNQQYEKGKMNKKQLLAYKVALDDAYDQKKAEQVKKELLSQITEKDKLKKEQEISIAEGEETSNIEQVIKEDEKVSEAISALQVLGYSKREIIEALQTIEVTSLSVEDIIKKGLANLAKKL